MRNIKLTIAYDGTNYSGWQIQPNGVTVQELLQKAVREMTGEANDVLGSGRTDAGVHALAQVASFKTEKKIPLEGFLKGINSILPGDIRITNCEEAAPGFHPMKDAKEKHYRYIISEAEYEHPLRLNRAWCIDRKLNIDAMNKAAAFLVGEHDFSSFRAADSSAESSVRRVLDVSVDSLRDVGEGLCPLPSKIACHPRERGCFRSAVIASVSEAIQCNPPVSPLYKRGVRGDSLDRHVALRSPRDDTTLSTNDGGEKIYAFTITGRGFLKHMVRNIVGTLVDVGLDKTSPAEFKNILESRDRKKAGVCAPACGLYLVGVKY